MPLTNNREPFDLNYLWHGKTMDEAVYVYTVKNTVIKMSQAYNL